MNSSEKYEKFDCERLDVVRIHQSVAKLDVFGQLTCYLAIILTTEPVLLLVIILQMMLLIGFVLTMN